MNSSRTVELKYSKLEQDKWTLSVFSDASLRGLPGKINSAMGYLVFLSDGYIPNKRTKCCILQWKACKVKRVMTSTYDAETISLELGLEEALIIKDQIRKMTGFGEELIKVEAFVDCRDTFEGNSTSNHPGPDTLMSRILLIFGPLTNTIETKRS